jgi:hypothetical protein
MTRSDEMGNALSDVIAEDLSRSYVERRVEDWTKRVENLFQKILRELPRGWTARRSSVTMDEELMRRHEVPPRELSRLSLVGPSGASATIEPYGLWVVGANGRLDLRSAVGTFVIIDQADSDLDNPKPRWMIAPLRDRSRARELSPEALAEALGA